MLDPDEEQPLRISDRGHPNLPVRNDLLASPRTNIFKQNNFVLLDDPPQDLALKPVQDMTAIDKLNLNDSVNE